MTDSLNPENIDWPEWPLFDRQRELLDTVTRGSRDADPDRTIVYPLLDSIEVSSGTLRRLARRKEIRDAYVIARVVYETSVNVCFLLTAPDKLARRARRHAQQKVLRELERTIEIAGSEILRIRWSGTDAMLADPINQELLREFTSKSGREITSWTPENVKQRLDAISTHFGQENSTGLAYGLLLYRHASEIAHGTLYGALFPWGAMDPSTPVKTVEQMEAFRIDQARLILMLAGFTLDSLNRISGTALGLPDVASKAREILLAYSKRPRPGSAAMKRAP